MKPPDDFELRNLTFHYPDGHLALRDVSLAVEAGECVGLVGPNGAGKSTLLLHLNGILPGRDDYDHHHLRGNGSRHSHDDQPRVFVGGIGIPGRHLKEVRRRVGLLFQEPNDQLFCPTVGEDVSFGPRNLGYSRQEAADATARCLATVGLAEFENRLPHHLSIGERKRVCLAAILACDPSVLALDEPTGSLDPAARRQLIELLKGLPQTKLIATHDLELVVELCERVVILDRGRVHADGPTREILRDEELLRSHQLEVPLSLLYERNSLASASRA